MKISNLILSLIPTLIVAALLPGCETNSPYDSIERRGKDLATDTKDSNLSVDSIYVDGAMTSLSGHWILRDSSLYFFDKYSVGLKAFSLDGRFLYERIKEGRGPDEMLSPAWCVALDGENGNFIVHGNENELSSIDRHYVVKPITRTWCTSISPKFGKKDWVDLYEHPDPAVPQMYEYNFVCNRIAVHGNRIIIPVITEHVSYNGYEKNTKDFWKNSRIFLSFDMDDLQGTCKIFGRYPPVYRHSNIPVFAAYDFAIAGDEIYVTFAADPRIYVLDMDGKPLYSFGKASDRISGRYPTTHSFSQYEKEREKTLGKHGYYSRIFVSGDTVLRTCHTDDGEWILQHYTGSDYAGSFRTGLPLEILGKIGDCYYAFARVDVENERFVFVKFKI